MYVVTPHLNRLGKKILVMGRDMSFKGVIWKIIPKLSLLPILIWRIAVLVSGGKTKFDAMSYLVDIFKNHMQKQKTNGLESWYTCTTLSNHCMKCKQPTKKPDQAIYRVTGDKLWKTVKDKAKVSYLIALLLLNC